MLPVAQTRDNRKLKPLDHYSVRASTQIISFGEINSEDLTFPLYKPDLIVTLPSFTRIPQIQRVEESKNKFTIKTEEKTLITVKNLNEKSFNN